MADYILLHHLCWPSPAGICFFAASQLDCIENSIRTLPKLSSLDSRSYSVTFSLYLCCRYCLEYPLQALFVGPTVGRSLDTAAWVRSRPRLQTIPDSRPMSSRSAHSPSLGQIKSAHLPPSAEHPHIASSISPRKLSTTGTAIQPSPRHEGLPESAHQLRGTHVCLSTQIWYTNKLSTAPLYAPDRGPYLSPN